MNPAGIVAAFLLGLLVGLLAVAWSDRRAVRREAVFWEELRLQVLDSYGQVFDWAEECEEFGCHEDTGR